MYALTYVEMYSEACPTSSETVGPGNKSYWYHISASLVYTFMGFTT